MRVYPMETSADREQVRALFWEYLQWADQALIEHFDVHFDIASMLENDMATLAKFQPPAGRLLLAEVEGQTAGLACLKALEGDMGEIKRMYVRPAYRHQGVGRALLQSLIDEAQQMGYAILRLDSARFMDAAHRLYHAAGFHDINAYVGSEIPVDFQQHWIFMELRLPKL
jgi:GNAT superfamily N-acetyltransferase